MSSGRRWRYSPKCEIRGRAKEKSASEMKKVSLSVSKGGECLSFYFITNALWTKTFRTPAVESCQKWDFVIYFSCSWFMPELRALNKPALKSCHRGIFESKTHGAKSLQLNVLVNLVLSPFLQATVMQQNHLLKIIPTHGAFFSLFLPAASEAWSWECFWKSWKSINLKKSEIWKILKIWKIREVFSFA